MSSPTEPEVSTAEIIKRRLLGLLVLLAVVFGLSVLLRGLGGPTADESKLQTVVVPLGGSELPAADTATILAAPEPEEAVAEADAPTEPAPPVAVAPAPISKPAASAPLPRPTKPAAVTPKEKEKSVASTSESAKKKNRWYILLGSFSDAANARALAQRAKSAGFSVDVSRIQTGGSTLNRVRVGPFKNESEAQSARATLIVEGLTGAKLQKEP
jgi:cell division septation protein DedD